MDTLMWNRLLFPLRLPRKNTVTMGSLWWHCLDSCKTAQSLTPHHCLRTIIANINRTRRQLASQHVPKTMFDFVYHWDVFWEPQDSVNLLEKCWLGQSCGRSKPNCFRRLPRGVGMSSKKESTYWSFSFWVEWVQLLYCFYQLFLKLNNGR